VELNDTTQTAHCRWYAWAEN